MALCSVRVTSAAKLTQEASLLSHVKDQMTETTKAFKSSLTERMKHDVVSSLPWEGDRTEHGNELSGRNGRRNRNIVD
jgi:hypothetical protein